MVYHIEQQSLIEALVNALPVEALEELDAMIDSETVTEQSVRDLLTKYHINAETIVKQKLQGGITQ